MVKSRPTVVERSRALTFSRSWMWRSAVRISAFPLLFLFSERNQLVENGSTRMRDDGSVNSTRRWKRKANAGAAIKDGKTGRRLLRFERGERTCRKSFGRETGEREMERTLNECYRPHLLNIEYV